MIFIYRLSSFLRIRHFIWVKFLLDLFLWSIVAPIAFILRLGDTVWEYGTETLVYTLFGLFVKALLAWLFKLHRQSWHKVGVRDLFVLIRASATCSVLLLAAAFMAYSFLPIPRSIPFIEGVLSISFLGGGRLSLRLLNESILETQSALPRRRILIVGAGEAGTMIAREMIRHPEAGMRPIAYLDDEPRKLGNSYLGVPVVGTLRDLPSQVKRLEIDEVLIAMPSAPGDTIRDVVQLARNARVSYRIIPGIYAILSAEIPISEIREVDVDDLLRREPVKLDLDEISDYLQDYVILVTGACGSIGSEIVRQISHFRPEHIILLDRNENGLYMFERELQRESLDVEFTSILADIQNSAKLNAIFEQYPPQVVFHAAAHKHVPLMERSPDEAILNNIVGTKNIIDMVLKYRVERFVNISTDKAVRPSSMMGASKRVAEMLVSHAAQAAPTNQRLVSVRFGNVLGSSGSVVPVFKRQIETGGPITITDPEATRYFMSIPEATQLVLQAAGMGKNGVIYVLDMGHPVKIIDLARDLIYLSGLQPDIDIPFEITGLRPGEKRHEELMTQEESQSASKHSKIFIVNNPILDSEVFDQGVQALIQAARSSNKEQIVASLQMLIPDYPYATDS